MGFFHNSNFGISIISTLILLCEQSNKQGIPLLLFLDDCDSYISQSVFMSFLDGNLSMRTKYGIYFVLATNNPRKIDHRIIKRPGRIDLIEIVGSVEGNFLADIFDIHLAYKIPYVRERIKEFGKMTGAQVKEVLQRSYQYAAQTDQKLSVELLLNVKTKLFELLTDKFDETEYESLYGKIEPIGYKISELPQHEIKIKGFGI